jgi:hypothetical protein
VLTTTVSSPASRALLARHAGRLDFATPVEADTRPAIEWAAHRRPKSADDEDDETELGPLLEHPATITADHARDV